MKKVAMIGSIHEDGWKILEEENCEVFEINDFSKKNLIEQLCDVDGIALRTAQLDEEILRKCPKLKIVARHGVGYDSVDLNYLNQNKQALAVTGTSNAVSVAEHVMMMFLCLTKQINKSDNFVRSGKFTKKNELPNFFELYKKNILILKNQKPFLNFWEHPKNQEIGDFSHRNFFDHRKFSIFQLC